MALRRRQFLMVSGAAMMLTHCKTAGFKDIYMSTDSDGKIRTSSFPSNAQGSRGIYVQIDYASGRDDARLTFTLGTLVDGELTEVADISSADGDDIFLSQGDGRLTIQLVARNGEETNPQGPFPVGEYLLTFYIGKGGSEKKDKEDTFKFSVYDETAEGDGSGDGG